MIQEGMCWICKEGLLYKLLRVGATHSRVRIEGWLIKTFSNKDIQMKFEAGHYRKL